jgi:DNA-binding response OmpR family regulator
MRILVAEDDEGLREVLVLGLTDAGYHVDAVDRGDDAIDQLKWYEYDVAVIDWRMPGEEGIDVVAWARKHDRPTGLLMLTARDTPADRIRGLDTGADDYLVKPFDFGELLARVRALQRRPRGVDELGQHDIQRRCAVALASRQPRLRKHLQPTGTNRCVRDRPTERSWIHHQVTRVLARLQKLGIACRANAVDHGATH